MYRKSAFTLVETVVCIAILALLVALIIPAVQSSREASRRLECSNRVRDLALAVSSFQASYNFFPRGIRPDGMLKSGSQFAATDFISVHVELLPFLEHNSLYNGLNLARSSNFEQASNHNTAANSTLSMVVLQAFLCPSDGKSSFGGTNYRFNVGPNVLMLENPRWPGGGGPFPGLGLVRPADVTDGLSQTVGLSERSHGSFAKSFDRSRDVWYSAVSLLRIPVDGDDMKSVCSSLTSQPLSFYSRSGYSWLAGGFENTLYNHVAIPNWTFADCSSDSYGSNDVSISGGIIGARSFHADGVNCGIMDGSVRFISNRVNSAVWQNLSTRSGGEIDSF